MNDAYMDEYLAAANTNPELVISREPEPPIEWRIDTEKLKKILRGDYTED